MGNLTLVTKPLNSHLSNGPWHDKRPDLEDALLALSSAMVKVEEWDEDAIRERAQSLAGKAVVIWPGLDSGSQ